MSELVENLRRAYGERIDALAWMSAETKVAAREKLGTFRPKIGYPDRWRDYSALEVRAGDAYGNNKRFQIFDWNHDVERLGRKRREIELDLLEQRELGRRRVRDRQERLEAHAVDHAQRRHRRERELREHRGLPVVAVELAYRGPAGVVLQARADGRGHGACYRC